MFLPNFQLAYFALYIIIVTVVVFSAERHGIIPNKLSPSNSKPVGFQDKDVTKPKIDATKDDEVVVERTRKQIKQSPKSTSFVRRIYTRPFEIPSKVKSPQENRQLYAYGTAMIALSSGIAYWNRQSFYSSTFKESSKVTSQDQPWYAGLSIESLQTSMGIGWEIALTELFRPRYPPITGVEVIRGDYRLLSAHLGEHLYHYTEPALNYLLHLAVTPENVTAITSLHWSLGALGWILVLDNGHTLRLLTKLALRWSIYPKVSQPLLRLISRATMGRLSNSAQMIFNYYYRRSRADYILAIKAMVQPRISPRQLVALVKGREQGQKLPMDIAVDIFEAMADMSTRDFDSFLEYYRVWLKHYFPSIKAFNQSQESLEDYISNSKRLLPYWQLRNLAEILEEPADDVVERVGLLIEKRPIKDILSALDWFIGNSRLFREVVENNSPKAFQILIEILRRLNIHGNFRNLVNCNAANILLLSWLDKKPGQLQYNQDDVEYALLHGNIEISSLVLSFYEGNFSRNIFGSIPKYETKRQFLKILPLAHSVKRFLQSRFVCGPYGSESVTMTMNFRDFDEEISEERIRRELGLGFIGIAMGIPKSLIHNLDDLPVVANMAEWLSATIVLYCREHDMKPTLTIQQRERPPTPMWLKKIHGGY